MSSVDIMSMTNDVLCLEMMCLTTIVILTEMFWGWTVPVIALSVHFFITLVLTFSSWLQFHRLSFMSYHRLL